MILRSMLFVPGDSEKKLASSERSVADALILDLEDSVEASRKATARTFVSAFLQRPGKRRHRSLWVRINPIATPDAALDLATVMAGRPHGIVLPKAASVDDVERLGEQLDMLEEQHGIDHRRTKILPIATETPASLLAMGEYSRSPSRLAGISWGAEDLSVALGATTNVDAQGEWLFTYQLARSVCLLAAHAAGAPAIDTVYKDIRDMEGLRRRVLDARRDGFNGKFAIHPAQVEVINAAFRPTDNEVAYAKRVVAAFEEAPGTGVISLDYRMLDLPHLRRAERVLALADEAEH